MSYPFWRRRNILVNRRLQLRFTGMLLLQTSFILAVLGVLVYSHVRQQADLAVAVPLADPTARIALQQELIDNVHGFHVRSLLLLGLTAATMLLCGLLASHRLAGPVVNLSRFLAEVGAGGSRARIAFRRKDNLDAFARHLNHMAESIDARREQAAQAASALARRAAGADGGDPVFLADAERLLGEYREAL